MALSPNAGEHWTEAYVGRACVAGEYDCADLAADVLRERFGRTVAFPARADGIRARDAQIAGLAGRLARPLEPGEEPREGDGVLMRQIGRRVAGHHIGIWTRAGGEPCVLHGLAGAGVRLHRLRALARSGLEATGVYRWL